MIQTLARLGYASKAFIYCTVGLLAAAAALNRGGTVTDTSGALRVILTDPLGNAVLFILAVGLCGYSVWRLLDAFFDPDRHGTGPGALVIRIGSVLRGLIYGGLGVEALRLARGLRASGSGDGKVRMMTATVMALPMGVWLIGIAGLIVAAYGVSQIVAAVKDDEDEKMDWSALPPQRRRVLSRICRFGVSARALIIVVLGGLLVRAAFQHDPGEAQGLRGSMRELAAFLPGRWLLAIIAFGLLAYSLDQALHARYRRIRPIR